MLFFTYGFIALFHFHLLDQWATEFLHALRMALLAAPMGRTERTDGVEARLEISNF